MRLSVVVLLLTAIFSTASSTPVHACGKSYPPYTRLSHNEAFVLDVNPETRIQTIRDASGKPLWSFSGGDFWYTMLSDDGCVVVSIDYWDTEGIFTLTFRNEDGIFLKRRIDDFLPHKSDDGENVALVTEGGMLYRFRFADGKLVEERSLRSFLDICRANSKELAVVAMLLSTAAMIGLCVCRRTRADQHPKA